MAKKLTREQRDNRMFYIACAILAAVVGFGLYFCQNYTVQYKTVPEIDTTAMPETQAYYMCYAALYYPDGFEDIQFTVKGQYAHVEGYYAVKVSPPASMVEDDAQVDDYILTFEFEPFYEFNASDGDVITVSGLFHLYEEGGRYYITLRYATVY